MGISDEIAFMTIAFDEMKISGTDEMMVEAFEIWCRN